MKPEIIQMIGLWIMRILLVGGAVAGGLLEKGGVAFYCFVALVASFYFLDD